MLDSIFMQVLDMSKTASIVILVVLLARLLLKKVPKVFSYALWAVVLFRLLCPVTFEAAVSIMPEMASVSQDYSLSEAPISMLGAAEAAYHAVGDAVNGPGYPDNRKRRGRQDKIRRFSLVGCLDLVRPVCVGGRYGRHASIQHRLLFEDSEKAVGGRSSAR